MHPWNRPLCSFIAGGPQFVIVRPPCKSDDDLFFVRADSGGRVNEVIEQRPAFGNLVAGAQAFG